MRPCEGCAVAGRGYGAPLACVKRDIRMRFGGLAACFPDSPADYQFMRFKSEAFLTLRFQEIAGGHGNAGVVCGGVCQRVGLGAWSARSSRPCGARPEGACGARGKTAEGAARSGLGAVRRVTAERWHPQLRRQTRLRGCRSVEQDGPGAAVRFDVGGILRGGRAGLRNKSADFGGAMRSADLWAARRGERPWREPPAYADRMSKNAGAFYSDSGDSCMTGLLRACIYGGRRGLHERGH